MSAPRHRIVDAHGAPVDVGEVVGRGGEGAVYAVRSRPDTLAKIYHDALPVAKADKLRAMLGLGTPGLAKLAAWPSGLLYASDTHAPVGLLMPRVPDKKDIHLLYGPRSRKAEFARADWRFLVRAAANTARAVAAVHSVGCVIGDVNHGGVLVAQDATVSLIDCDSFQVAAGGRRFSCDVGVDTFTPPELQGKPFAGMLRTPDHDAFGLAVMAFLLLFMGKHPFSGRYGGPGDMPIGRAIEEFRFAYGTTRKSAGMEPPPGALPLSYVGEEMEGMFELAFSKRGTMEGRPDPRRWIASLQHLEETAGQCATQPSHWFPGHFRDCPWCRVEQVTGTLLFPILVGSDGRGTADVEALWRHALSLRSPGPAPTLDRPSPEPSPEAAAFRRPSPEAPDERVRTMPAVIAGLVTFISLIVVAAPLGLAWVAFAGAVLAVTIAWKTSERGVGVRNAAKNREATAERARLLGEVERRKTEVNRLSVIHGNLLARWSRKAGPADFERTLRELSTLRDQWNGLPRRRTQQLDELRRNLRRSQSEAYLDRVDIASATIDGVASGRKQMLASYGIETARDVDPGRLGAVPKFGPKTIERMMAWRRDVEARFVFDPNRPVDPRQVRAVEQSFLAERLKLETAARAAHVAVVQAHATVEANRRILRPQLEAAAAALAQAEADRADLSV